VAAPAAACSIQINLNFITGSERAREKKEQDKEKVTKNDPQ
jgi:hypothetical protein